MNIKHLFFLIACFSFTQKTHSQIIIDEVVVVVGEEMIKESDIQNQIMQLQKEGEKNIQTCKILEDLLFQKLLFNQAKIDSIEVADAEVDAEIERRINIFTGQEGGLEKLESFYDKTELEIKTEWRPLVREQIMAQRMQNSVVGNVEVTPNEVRTFFTKFSTDSLPTIPIQYEYAQIVIQPEMSNKEEQEIKQKLEEIRQRAIKGESFDKLAVLYSDDMESAKMG
ncbi:MAG TPA: peptidylprolyl isomerase, partial [Bacteroidales bacterium]|nr:peptidylprolyl isomerase [Bacteroidales bacterium]